MKTLKKPQIALGDVYGKCTATIRCDESRARLNGIADALRESESLYESRAVSAELYLFQESSSVGDVPGADLGKLYTQTFVRDGGPTRDLYELLRKAPGNICPLCCQRVVGTLDHYLPKARHPAFAVTPLNLVPACIDCNVDSKQKRPNAGEEQTLHPYFDGADSEIWLVAQVVCGEPPGVSFSVRDVPSWSELKNGMVRSHFSAFKLGSLYADHAGAELVNVYVDLDDGELLGNADATRAHLGQQASRRRRSFKNSWQGALYEALAESDWFCSVGVLGVRESELFPSDYL